LTDIGTCFGGIDFGRLSSAYAARRLDVIGNLGAACLVGAGFAGPALPATANLP
jgi:hypothetical protein